MTMAKISSIDQVKNAKNKLRANIPAQISELASKLSQNNKSSSANVDNMDEMSESGIILQKPYNPTDLKVVCDPTFERNLMAKLYNESANGGIQVNNGKYNPLLVEGHIIPIVQINGYNVSSADIVSIDLDFTGFAPTIELEVNDSNGVIKSSANTGMNNMINIVITSAIDGIYRKIFAEFYITNQPYPDSQYLLKFKGVYKYNLFNSIIIRDLCESHVNGQTSTSSFSTYDTFKRVAKLTKFGFAASGGCKDVSDIDLRILEGETFIDFLKKTLKYSGLDEKSMFDGWIDGHGYLCLANVYWILNSEVNPSQLTLDVIVGISTQQNITENKRSITAPRLITNSLTSQTTSNMYYKEFSHDIDLSINRKNGTSQRYYSVCPIGVNNGTNGIQETDVQQIENSVDGSVHTDNYEFQQKEYIGVEFTERQIKLQAKSRENYFAKLRSDRLVITMANPNLGLERGMLVCVNVQEHNAGRIISNRENISNAINTNLNQSPQEVIDNIANTDNRNVIGNQGVEGIHPDTDMYYIDGVRFIYRKYNHKIEQVLYLIKKGVKLNLHPESYLVESNQVQITSAQSIAASIQAQSDNKNSQLFASINKDSAVNRKNI